jgi:hypothetical protein
MPASEKRHFGAPRILVACASVGAVALSGCAASSTPLSARQKAVQSTNTNVKFKDCADACTGEIDGAKYSIKLPTQWNGTLLLYSHGYRFAQPSPPDFSAERTTAQVSSTDSDGTGTDELSKKLLAAGYALAGSSYKSNGWAVADGVEAGKAVHQKFIDLVGKPNRTYVWGDSLGGLITEVLAENNTDWVDGAAPMCGAVAGPILNFDLALDVETAIKALVDPSFKVADFASADEAAANWKHAAAAMVKAASDVSGGGTAKVLYIAGLVDAPTQTATYDGHDVVSQVKARVEMLLTALAFGTSGRYELEQRVKGNVSDNSQTDYSSRISGEEAGLIALAGGDVATLNSAMAKAPRVTADAGAVQTAESLGDTTGNITVPTITLHTVADPLVIAQNENVLARRALSSGKAGNLIAAYVKAPATYSETDKAPYGAGHCNFTVDQRVGLISALDGWVRSKTIPLPPAMAARIGTGYDYAYDAPDWPAPVK